MSNYESGGFIFHKNKANVAYNLAKIYFYQQKYDLAEPLLNDTLKIYGTDLIDTEENQDKNKIIADAMYLLACLSRMR
jgi:hypothetical protein